MNIYATLLITVSLLAAPSISRAGLVELEAGVMHRLSTVEKSTNNYSKSTSYTGSFSYYFWQMSALELSYTSGLSELSVQQPNDPSTRIVYKTKYSMLGLDLVITFAGRSAVLQPYVKAGAARMQKQILTEYANGTQGGDPVKKDPEVVPTGGLGFKLRFTKTLSLKVGVDFWWSDINSDDDNQTLDYAGRAGIVWLL